MNEREAHEFVRPLEALPAIEARRRRRRWNPARAAVAIGAIGIVGTGSAVAAIEKLSGSEKDAREHQRLESQANASDAEIYRDVHEHSGGSIVRSEIDPEGIRRAARRELGSQFPDQLRFYDADHKLVDTTRCTWPNPNPECSDPITAIKDHPGATIVETWSDGKPIAGGS